MFGVRRATPKQVKNGKKRQRVIDSWSPPFDYVFSRLTWNLMTWDGLVQPTGKYCSIHRMEYPEFQTGIT